MSFLNIILYQLCTDDYIQRLQAFLLSVSVSAVHYVPISQPYPLLYNYKHQSEAYDIKSFFHNFFPFILQINQHNQLASNTISSSGHIHILNIE